MSKPFNIVIVGGGPAGLSSALAIAQHPSASSSPVRITVLELRRDVQTIGGAVNLTPLALRYLDAVGAGPRLRPRGNPASAIDLVAHRTGRVLASLWPGIDALRVRREAIVESLLQAAAEDVDTSRLNVVYGARVTDINEHGDADGEGGVKVTYTLTTDGDTPTKEHVLDADVVIGCDGIHSFVRRQVVEPDRPKTYTGKCVAYGFIPVSATEASGWLRADGTPLVRDTTLVQLGSESLLLAYHQPPGPSRAELYLAAVMPVPEAGGGGDGGGDGGPSRTREGWAVQGADREGLRRRITAMFAGGGITCLSEIVSRCDNWFFYPVYMLPDGGVWSKGRVILLGDAAHAMPPQGESTGIAIEDGVLLAHILSRRGERSVARMLDDYGTLRRRDVSELYKTSMARWNSPAQAGSWVGSVFMEWMAWVVVSYLNWTSNHFGRDVRDLPLPE